MKRLIKKANINFTINCKMTTCSICLEDSIDETKTVACHHIFHIACIDEWLKTNITCSTCRTTRYSPPNHFFYKF